MAEKYTEDKTYWKSFRELHRDPEVLKHLGDEFHPARDESSSAASFMSRRTFIGLLAASAAFAGVGCRRPEQTIVPYVRKPEYHTPGIADYFATTFTHQNFAYGLLVKSREGRPIKIEGNDVDPISGGKSSHLAQASLLSLYDPDRVLRPTVNNSDSTPRNAFRRMADAIREVTAVGKRVRILVDEHASPALHALYRDIEAVMPNTRVITWPAVVAYGAAEANSRLLGIDGVLIPDLSKADVILSIESDVLGTDPESLWHIRRFSSRRKPKRTSVDMSRLYSVESSMTLTGSNADIRIPLPSTELNAFLLGLLHELCVVRGMGALDESLAALLSEARSDRFSGLAKVAEDLASNPSVVVVGRHLPVETHALGVLLNRVLGAYGENAIIDTRHVLPYSASKKEEIEEVTRELLQGDVGVLLLADVNPAYSMSGGAFRDSIAKTQHVFSLSRYADESSKHCSIFVPVNHYLEAWGDAVMFDGSRAVTQPLIAPLNEGQASLGDALMGIVREVNEQAFETTETWYDYLREHWRKHVFPASGRPYFDHFWNETLRRGSIPGAPEPRRLTFNSEAAAALLRIAGMQPDSALRLCVLPSNSLYDGRDANLGWLQETPDPVTKVTWGNVVMMNQATARRLGCRQEDVVRLVTDAGSIEVPVFIQPGMADDSLATTTGFGRTEGGRVLDGYGSNAFSLMPLLTQSIGHVEVTVESTGRRMSIATTQDHHSLSGGNLYDIDRRDIVKEATLKQYEEDAAAIYRHDLPVYGAKKNTDRPISITKPFDYSSGHRWGMTIDTSACVGCNACVVACVAENNIPVVGKEQVIRGREMHWIRIDRYYAGDENNPETLRQPMLCQHCEKAPCENVCPVAATTHSPEGLNEMTYNRCVGTRYCSNNCPYKVRRFNYFDYHGEPRDPLSLIFNPDVTVRMRGVMEKCTFCVQRINEAKYSAKNEGREVLRDGEVSTACQQACPADAIVFGNTNDPESSVSKNRVGDRGYHVLRELNVLPSITYLAKIRNSEGGME